MAKTSSNTSSPLSRQNSPLTSLQDLDDDLRLIKPRDYSASVEPDSEVVSLVAATMNQNQNTRDPPRRPPITSEQKESSKQEHKCVKCCKKGGLCSCFKVQDNNKWSTSINENVFKSDEVAETKYPRVYKILDMKIWDFLFVFSCLASIFLYTFCEGFLIENRILWGMIHVTNALYTILLLLQWVQVILKTKYAPNSFTTVDIIFSLLSVLPIDLIVLLIHSINSEGSRPEDYLTFTVSRLHYCFRIKNVVNYLSNWENQLILGDFHSFLLRVLLYTTFIIHSFACVWHRLACRSFRPRHFMMEPTQARNELCLPDSWIMKLSIRANGNGNRTGPIPAAPFPFLQDERIGTGILWDHYAVSLFWSAAIAFRLGYGDIQLDIKNYGEILFATICQIIAWIFSLAVVSATLTALLIERETEQQKFLTRKTAIKHYLEFSWVKQTVCRELNCFYDYLWLKRKGFSELKLFDFMPSTIKSEIYYDIHKPLLEQILTFSDLDPGFLAALSLRMKHSYHLEGEILYRKYERGKRMYLVLKGYLEVLSADESHPIACIKSGSFIGELFIMHPYFHGCTVQCGSSCDMLSLSRTSMKEALADYPQYFDMLQSRIEDRFDQAVVLLSLATKYNEAPRLFERLRNEMPTPILTEPQGSTPRRRKMTTFIRDADGLTIAASVAEKMTQGKNKTKELTEKATQSLQEQAFRAFSNDVTRALTLVKEMGGVRCPLIVTPPDDYDFDFDEARRDSWANTRNRRSCCRRLQELSLPKPEDMSLCFLCWKGFVSLFVLAVLLYYPYQFSFRRSTNTTNVMMNMVAHLFDLIFALDFILDQVQIITTPEGRLWKIRQVLAYRLRTCNFYWRMLAFLPIEYTFIWIIETKNINSSPWFYLFKLNRLIEVSVLMKFCKDLQSRTRIPILAVFLVKCILILVYTIHIFAVLFKFLTCDFSPVVYGKPNATSAVRAALGTGSYELSFYWATQSVVVVGFGDVNLLYGLEIFLLSLAFITGTIIITYSGCKLATIITNASRKRIIFRQTYYSLTAFLKIRSFPEDLAERLKNYFKAHWTAHEGILLSDGKSPIWDAPKVLSTEVMLSQGLRYIVKVPLFKYVHEPVLKETCRALKQYVVPPNETILLEGDLRRDLYMIVKGFCVVHRGKELIGHLSEGNYFGLSGLVMGVNQNFRITTDTHCYLFCLEFNDFVQIAKKHVMIRKDYKILRGELHLERRPSLKISKQKVTQIASPSVPLVPATMAHLAKDLQLYDDEFEESRKKSKEKDEKPTELSKTDLDQVQNQSDIQSPKSNLKCKCCRFFLLRKAIMPNGRFMFGWMTFRCACAVLISCTVIAQIAFSFHPTPTFFVIILFDIIAWIDLYIMLNVAYYCNLNQLVTDPLKCAAHFLKGPFLLDLLLCFPFDLIAILATPEIDVIRGNYAGNFRWISLLRLNRFFQVYKLVQSSIYCGRTVSKSLLLITFAEIVPWAAFFIHFIACISVYKVCTLSNNGGSINCSKDAWITHGDLFLDDSIHKVYEFQQQPFKMYLTALYWTLTTVMRVGYGDIELSTMENRMIATFIMIFGTIMVTFISSKLTASLFGEDPRRIELRTKVGVMQSFLGRFKVSRSVQRRVSDVYCNEWDTTTGIPIESLLGSLLPSLRTDVMTHLYEDSIRQSPLLKNLDDVGIRLLASMVREDFLVEGEYLFQYGNMTDEVFLVTSGIVGAYNVKGEIMSYMAPGSLIGEMSALYGVTRLYNAKAATDTDVLIFNTEDFLNFLEMYPDLKDTVEQLCIRYYQDMMNRSLNVASLDVSLKSEEKKGDLNKRKEADKNPVAPARSVFSNAPELQSKPAFTDGGKISENKETQIGSGRNFCVLDPLRVPLRKGQIKDKEKELLLQEVTQTKTWWNVFITYGRTPKSEMAFLHIFEDKKHCSCLKYTIHPASPLLQSAWWSVFCLVVTALSCSLTSYELAFYSLKDEQTIWIISGVRNFIEIFFVARIILTFHLGFHDVEGLLVTNTKAIAKRYCCRFNGFVVDVITTFPFYTLIYTIRSANTTDNVYHIHDASIRGIQLLRVLLFLRYLNHAESNLRMKASQVKIIKILVILFFTFHFCACAWYIIACYASICEPLSWMDVILYKLISSKQIDKKDDVKMGTRYFMSLEFVATTISDCGLSEITARLPIELFITIVYVFCALFAVGVLAGRMTQIVTSQIFRKIHYEQELSVIDSHFLSLGLQKSKRDMITEYYKLVWRRFRGMSYYSLLCELPFPLRSDIAFEVYGPNVKNSRVFGKIDELIMRQMTARIRHEFYLPGTHIVRGGNVCEAVYFIKRGEVLIIDENMGIELCVETLYENDCFGEIKVLLNHETFRFSYVARLESEIGVLCHDDLDEILQNFPALRTDLIGKAHRIKSHRIDVKAQSELRQTFDADSISGSIDQDEKRGSREAPIPKVTRPTYIHRSSSKDDQHYTKTGNRLSSVPKIDPLESKKRGSSDQKEKERKISVQKKASSSGSGMIGGEKKRQGSTSSKTSVPKKKVSKTGSVSAIPLSASRKGSTKKTNEDKKKN